MQKLNTKGFIHVTTILAVIVIVAISAIGVKLLNDSHAATIGNGKLYNWYHTLYSTALAPVSKQLVFPATSDSNCYSNGAGYITLSPNGQKAANLCVSKTNSSVNNIVTYTTTTGGSFKKIGSIPTTSWKSNIRWQKVALTGKNAQLVAFEYDTTKAYTVVALYDTVTGVRQTVNVGGVENFLGAGAGTYSYDWSQDGKKILYSRIQTSLTAPLSVTLCSIDISLTSPTQTCAAPVSISGAGYNGLAYSRDGLKVAVLTSTSQSISATATTSLFTMNTVGTPVPKLLKTGAVGDNLTSPVWSPDGTLIVMQGTNYATTPSKKTVQIRSAATGAVTKQVADTNGNIGPIKAWIPVIL